MIVEAKKFSRHGLDYVIRSAVVSDAGSLSEVRVLIDGETEHLDRYPGEGFIDATGFADVIENDSTKERNLFLVATVNERIVGYSRCEGTYLRRFAHKVEFGVGVRRNFWGHGIGKNLLLQSTRWADSNGIAKMTLSVLETNAAAVQLYRHCGFEIEGILRRDRLLADKQYYNTLVMGRFLPCGH